MTWSGSGTLRAETTSTGVPVLESLHQGGGAGPDHRLEGPHHRGLEPRLHQPCDSGCARAGRSASSWAATRTWSRSRRRGCRVRRRRWRGRSRWPTHRRAWPRPRTPAPRSRPRAPRPATGRRAGRGRGVELGVDQPRRQRRARSRRRRHGPPYRARTSSPGGVRCRGRIGEMRGPAGAQRGHPLGEVGFGHHGPEPVVGSPGPPWRRRGGGRCRAGAWWRPARPARSPSPGSARSAPRCPGARRGASPCSPARCRPPPRRARTRLESSRSAARVSPMRRGTSHDNPNSAGRPRRPWEVVSLAPAAAKRRSQ